MPTRHRAAARPADFAASQHRDAAWARGYRRASRGIAASPCRGHQGRGPRGARRDRARSALLERAARQRPGRQGPRRAVRGRVRHDGDDRARRRPPPDLAHRRRGRSRSRTRHAVLRVAGGAGADRQACRRCGPRRQFRYRDRRD